MQLINGVPNYNANRPRTDNHWALAVEYVNRIDSYENGSVEATLCSLVLRIQRHSMFTTIRASSLYKLIHANIWKDSLDYAADMSVINRRLHCKIIAAETMIGVLDRIKKECS